MLVAWLFHTNMRVAQLETKLYKCLETEKYYDEVKRLSEAVLPKKISYEAESNS